MYGSEVHAQRRRDRNRSEIGASHDAADSQVPLPETRRELKWADQQRTQPTQHASHYAGGKQTVARPYLCSAAGQLTTSVMGEFVAVIYLRHTPVWRTEHSLWLKT